MRTSQLEVRVRLNPFRVAFYDLAGHLISKDDDARGTAWEGHRLRSWKWMPQDEHYFGLGEKAGPLDRRGHAYQMWNTDAYPWGANSDPLYEDVPVLHGPASGARLTDCSSTTPIVLPSTSVWKRRPSTPLAQKAAS